MLVAPAGRKIEPHDQFEYHACFMCIWLSYPASQQKWPATSRSHAQRTSAIRRNYHVRPCHGRVAITDERERERGGGREEDATRRGGVSRYSGGGEEGGLNKKCENSAQVSLLLLCGFVLPPRPFSACTYRTARVHVGASGWVYLCAH